MESPNNDSISVVFNLVDGVVYFNCKETPKLQNTAADSVASGFTCGC